MWKAAVVSVALCLPAIALACGGDDGVTMASANTSSHAAMDPTGCAKKAELMGGACSYTTGMMAQRVVADGKLWAFTGSLSPVQTRLASHVAAPFTVGPDKVYVVANEVLDALTDAGVQAGRVSLEGKLLEVDGIKYYVLTGFQSLNS
jgi:hypothetical protein